MMVVLKVEAQVRRRDATGMPHTKGAIVSHYYLHYHYTSIHYHIYYYII